MIAKNKIINSLINSFPISKKQIVTIGNAIVDIAGIRQLNRYSQW